MECEKKGRIWFYAVPGGVEIVCKFEEAAFPGGQNAVAVAINGDFEDG